MSCECKIEKRYWVMVAGDFSVEPNSLCVESPVHERSDIGEFVFLRTEIIG